ncbi:MAG: sulfatase-like hydrolase/transferase [Methylococcaceae bacterium]
MKYHLVSILLGFLLTVVLDTAFATTDKTNVVILLSDDQRWDVITAKYMPNVYKNVVETGIAFNNSFVPNPLCCPSRTSILTGNHSHTTSVWSNDSPPYGGFFSFDDKDTIAIDFHQAGYRTAMIGKYLNAYNAGRNRYIPAGWDTWFAVHGSGVGADGDNEGAYYNYGVTATKDKVPYNNGVSASKGKLLHYGHSENDYVARVVSEQAINFVNNSVKANKPFFLYYAFNAPHMPATPDPRDLTRFAGETKTARHDDMLESAFSMDREIGNLFAVLPKNTLVVFMSDNGYLWGESKGNRGVLNGKLWPYNESIRVPIYITSLNGTLTPKANRDDIVLNIDLRTTLSHAVGITPTIQTEGIDWFDSNYKARTVFPLEHLRGKRGNVDTYCGVREQKFMYVRYKLKDNSYLEELYNEPNEILNLIGNPLYRADYNRLKSEAMNLCNPTPPGYIW